MDKREKVQEQIIDTIVKKDFKGIVLASVRSGKTRCLLTSIQKHSKITNPKILVLFPFVDIKQSWEDEGIKIRFPYTITYSTFASIDKIKKESYDYIIFDEAHLLSENQLSIVKEICKKNKHILFASGTYSNETLYNIKQASMSELIVNYNTDNAVQDGLISDYTIYVHEYTLDDKQREFKGFSKTWYSTDIKESVRLSKKVDESFGKTKMMAALNRMRFINSCGSMTDAVNSWIKNNLDKRFLLFTGDENVGKKFNLPMFNSKSIDDTILKQFQEERINQLCLIRKGSSGITYPNLDNIIITAINSNGENLIQMLGRALLLDTVHSDIHIFVSNTTFQQNWLLSALENINKDKIIYLNKQLSHNTYLSL